MQTNINSFPTIVPGPVANDDMPSGPGGAVVSISHVRRRSRMVRTLRGVFFVNGAMGHAHAA